VLSNTSRFCAAPRIAWAERLYFENLLSLMLTGFGERMPFGMRDAAKGGA
jgi:hypothetical protein